MSLSFLSIEYQQISIPAKQTFEQNMYASIHHFLGTPLIGWLLLQHMAISNKIIRVVNILGPEWTEMLKADFQPWFRLAIIVNHCCLFHIFNVSLILIAQSKHVPRGINRMNMIPECDQSRRQSSKLPQRQVRLQILQQPTISEWEQKNTPKNWIKLNRLSRKLYLPLEILKCKSPFSNYHS